MDIRGCTPLHIAATYGNSEALELLIEYKANIWALEDRGLYPAKVAAFNKRLECFKILDNIVVQLNSRNPDFVRQQQMKAFKDLQKRAKENHKNVTKKNYNTAPRIKAKPKKEKKKKEQTPETTFVLQKPGENEDSEDDEQDEDDDEIQEMVAISGKNTLRPLPKMTSGAMLTTFNELSKRPMRFEYPDELQSSNSDPTLLQRRQRQGSGRAITQVIPLNMTELELENDSPLATFLHSLDLYDIAQILLHERMDLESLSLCSQDDLQKIGLQFGPIMKIHGAMLRRKETMDTPFEGRLMKSTDL